MLMMLITAIPIVGQIMVLVWAFVGENESRKNYFRAMLMWLLVFLALAVFLGFLGSGPAILKHIEAWTKRA